MWRRLIHTCCSAQTDQILIVRQSQVNDNSTAVSPDVLLFKVLITVRSNTTTERIIHQRQHTPEVDLGQKGVVSLRTENRNCERIILDVAFPETLTAHLFLSSGPDPERISVVSFKDNQTHHLEVINPAPDRSQMTRINESSSPGSPRVCTGTSPSLPTSETQPSDNNHAARAGRSPP